MSSCPSASAPGNWLIRQRVPIGQIPLPHARREAWIAVAYALFYAVAAIVVGLLIRSHPLPIWAAARFNQDVRYTFFYKITLLLILPVSAYYRAGYRAKDLLLGWEERRARVARLPLDYAAGFFLNGAHLPGIAAAVQSRPAAEAAARVAIGVVLPLFTAALPEEIFFRGILQTRLEAVSGRWPAILGTAALFTLWHIPSRYLLSHGFEGQAGSLSSVLLGTALPVFLSGLIASLIWDRFRNLPVLIAIHWGVDTLPAVASMLGISY